MGKSLTDTAKAILSESNDPTPDRDAKLMTPNKATLRPGSRSVDPNPMSNEADEIADAPKAPGEGENVGAKAAAKIGKDTSKSGQSAVPAEPSHLGESEDLDEEIEMTEELEAFIAEMIDKGLSEEEIAEAIEENFEIVEEVLEEEKDEDDEDYEDDEKKEKIDVKEHIDALLAGESLSEEFKAKAETIFESAIAVRVNEEVAVLEEAYEQALVEQVQQIQANLQEQVNDYLNYVVEQWIADNEVAVESALRTELTEEFISGLRNLMAEHNFDLPEEKVSVVEELGEKVVELEEKLNEEIERNVTLKKQIGESKKFEAIVAACEGLTVTQAERLKALAENVDFTDAEEFTAKIETLKESYFPAGSKSAPVLDKEEDTQGLISESEHSPMNRYVKALGKTRLK